MSKATQYRGLVYLPNPASQKTNNTQVSSSEQQELVRVYPNPASDVVNVVANGVVKGHVELFDLTGKLLLQSEISNGVAILKVENLIPGIYLARIYADENEEIAEVKIVIASK